MSFVPRSLIPQSVFQLYHRVYAWIADIRYGHPSASMGVVGVTGTNGKTTTSWLIAKALEANGDSTGCTTTALFKVGREEWLNDKKMTMLGRMDLQKLLRRMVDASCKYAVVETSSQGVLQSRHKGVWYDVAVFTNLTPEHIEAHGGFEQYKEAKIELFRHLAASRPKQLGNALIPRVSVLNRDAEWVKEFLVPGIHTVYWYGMGVATDGSAGTWALDVKSEGWGSSFTVEGQRYRINLPGRINIENALAAIAVATKVFGMEPSAVAKRLESVSGVPGRFERILEGQDFDVVVDYAAEPAALEKLYEVAKLAKRGRIIHVFGSCGGGRDRARRPVLGRMAAGFADVAIVTNEDPYEDDPMEIMNEIAAGARAAGMTEPRLQVIPDRAEAIRAAIREAKPGDLILLTGKGSEQAIMGPNGSRIPWDEREVARQAIRLRSRV